MRATLDWSHGLLGEEEIRLLGRLFLFVGGFSLPAAISFDEAVAHALGAGTGGPGSPSER